MSSRRGGLLGEPKNYRKYEMAGGVRNSDRARKVRSSRLKNVVEQALDENAKTA